MFTISFEKKCILSMSSKCNKCNKRTDLHHKSKIQNHHTRITQTKHYTQQQHSHPMVGIFDFPLGKFGGPEKGRFVVIGAGHNSDSSEDLYLTPPFFYYYFIFFNFFCYPALPLSPQPLPFVATPTTIFAPTVSPTCTRTVTVLSPLTPSFTL